MPLAPGTKLGPYEIGAPLGAGGMGEVYRARDTRLDRSVAVKILPASLSSDPVRKQRFEREAKAISSLNHPHICVLHDVGHQDGIDFLVMECVEGETLAKRLEKGPLPLEQVLKIGAQVADALDKAHRSGVIHRDLKPANIMLTQSGAKLLDFGLAKPASAPASAATLTAANSAPMTEEGTIVGTFQYMSPEQVEGKDLDGRSDIFSLGGVLYEMVTGKRAFEGRSQLSVASAILEKEPAPIAAIKPLTPPALDHSIRRCLAKDPDERWQTARDLALELKWSAESGSHPGVPASVFPKRRTLDPLGWLLAALFLLALCSVGAAWWFHAHQTPPASFFHSSVALAANDLALSPDGRFLALVAYSDQANKYVIWTHELGSRNATALSGTEDASHPFWSPDSRSIGFFANGKLKRVDITGGSAQILCEAPNGRGGAWNPEGVILFTPDFFTGLSQVSSAGGTPNEVTHPDFSRYESSHRWPVFLPDGRHFLYLAANFAGRFDKNEIFLGSLDSTEKRPILSASANVSYADPGYLLYMRDNTLVAQKFDPRTFLLSGETHSLSDEVQYFPQTDLALFGVAGKSTLIVQSGKGADKSQLTWFDRTGRPAGAIGSPGGFANPSISPDGRRVAFEQTDRDGRHVDIWIHELANNSTLRFTFGSSLNEIPIWSPDGKRIAYGSSQKLNFNLYQKNADGSGSEEQITDFGNMQTGIWDWSRDGKFLLVRKDVELWYLSAADHQAKPFLQPKWIVRNAQLSPDGKWVAYASNENGSWEVYVSPFPNPNSRWQVSRGGGEPRWRRDGKELFYLAADGKLMSVPVKTAATFEAGSPVALFQTHMRQPISAQDLFSYDVAADGQKFLINTKVDEPNAAPLSIILNWASDMEK
jgi:serine/threonine protein kinase